MGKLNNIVSNALASAPAGNIDEYVEKYLEECGVVLLPFKPGESFFYIGRPSLRGKDRVVEGVVSSVEFFADGVVVNDTNGLDFLPKSIFHTYAEAEAELRWLNEH